MQLKYEQNSYQLQAINSISNLFIGQNKIINEYDIFDGEAVISNKLVLSDEDILKNLQSVQKENSINNIAKELKTLDFSIEMETGTGKTYVYLRTILELFFKYGWSKFIIVVPSIAIKEGVLNSFSSMQEHFKSLYNTFYEYFEYDSARLNTLKHFVRDNNLQIMVMTIDSFKRNNTILNNYQEGFISTPKDAIKKTNPILILDEPQNMESELSKKAINELNPLFTLRFSATHKNYYNLIYSLNAKEALQQGLVKQIDILALSEQQTINDVYINVIDIEIDKKLKRPIAKLELVAQNKEQFVKKSFKIKLNDNLSIKTKNSIYQDFIVNEINFIDMFISFENGKKLYKHQVNGKVNKQLQMEQITSAIELHLKKYEELKKQGIKVLSLFFVDRVANFLDSEDGWMQKWFEDEFNRLKNNYDSFKSIDAKDIYSYYFAKRKNGFVDELKNNESDRKLAKQTYDLIMKSKEKLLNFDEKTSFIFSHSALKEGWDNPNVFFITTLNDTKSDMKKKQIIGRGLRLCVDKNGQRVKDKSINRLTIIVNESFEEFAKELQVSESINNTQNTPLNNIKKRKKAILKKEFLQENKEFLELWEKIKYKTTFKLKLDTDEYKQKVIKRLETIETAEKKILKQFGNVEDGYIQDEVNIDTNFSETLPNMVKIIEKEIKISKKTIIDIFKNISLKEFIKNSDEYLKKAIEIFEDEKHNILTEAIVYEKTDKTYEFNNIFLNEIENFNMQKCNNGLYTLEPYDSDVEKDFIECANRFKIFTKLPSRFKIATPFGNYNPDFAIIKHNDIQSGYVVETKGSKKQRDLKQVENWKIAYAKKHFECLDVKYKNKINDCKTL